MPSCGHIAVLVDQRDDLSWSAGPSGGGPGGGSVSGEGLPGWCVLTIFSKNISFLEEKYTREKRESACPLVNVNKLTFTEILWSIITLNTPQLVLVRHGGGYIHIYTSSLDRHC